MCEPIPEGSCHNKGCLRGTKRGTFCLFKKAIFDGDAEDFF